MNYPSSPSWSDNNKRLIILILLGVLTLIIYRVRLLLLPLIMAFVLAYLIEPVVRFIVEKTPIPRLASLALVYLVILAGLLAIPASAIPPLVAQGNNFINSTPRYLIQLGEFLREPITLSDDIEIPIDELALDQAYTAVAQNINSMLEAIGSQTLTIFGNVATATISTVGWTVVVLFLSFYLVKDHQMLFDAILDLVPPSYRGDFLQLSDRIGVTWNAFLRGQLVLCLVVGLIVLALALIVGLPNALVLALIAGIMELIPTFGPIFAAIPAVLIAYFQGDASWLGSMMSPFWFSALIAGLYGLIYQTENYVLVPRIMGHHLRLHPLLVILAALAGASIAGFLGILLAAPVLASAKLIFFYIYHKLLDQDPFTDLPSPVKKRKRSETAVQPDKTSQPTPESSASGSLVDGEAKPKISTD